jgi:regulatory protein
VESDLRKISQKRLTPSVALEKMMSWCAYQERSQFETRMKLGEYGLKGDDAETIIAKLIQENFLNEERFAMTFARGKFSIKKWGKIKIKIELKSRKVSDYCINKALQQINENDYIRTLEKVIDQKKRLLKETNKILRNYKLFQHATAKGFEKDLIADVLKELDI